jgi:hypothetical protein
MNRNHKKHWESITGLKQVRGLILRPSARRTKDLWRLNRNQLRWVVGLFTGQCHLKGHLFKLGLTDNPTCERCLRKDESATHILCDCETIAYLKFRHLGPILWTKWLLRHPHKQSPTFHSKCRTDKGLTKRGSTKEQWWSQCKGEIIVAHNLCIHLSFIHSRNHNYHVWQ